MAQHKQVRGLKAERIKDEVYRRMFRLEERRTGAETKLALALLRAWIDFDKRPSDCEERDWLNKVSPICLEMIESALRSGGPEHPCAP
jgi:hypothetical protein